MDASSLFKEHANEKYRNEVQALMNELDLHLVSLSVLSGRSAAYKDDIAPLHCPFEN